MIARSAFPSSLRSTTTTSLGALSVVTNTGASNPPAPSPPKIITRLVSDRVTTASTLPSPLTSAKTNLEGISPSATATGESSVVVPFPANTQSALLNSSSTTMSAFPSPSRSETSTSMGAPSTLKSTTVYPESKSPVKTEIERPARLAVINSSVPSPSKSAVATARGARPTNKSFCRVSPPRLSPTKIFRRSLSSLIAMTSSLPSPLRSTERTSTRPSRDPYSTLTWGLNLELPLTGENKTSKCPSWSMSANRGSFKPLAKL